MNKLILRAGMFAVSAFFAQAAMADDVGIKVRGGAASTDYGFDYSWGGGGGGSVTSQYTATNLGLTYVTPVGLYFDVSVSNGSGTHDLNTTPATFERNDQAFVVGMAGLGRASVYIGYKSGTSDLFAPPGATSWTVDTFKASGFILGGGAGFPLGEDGRAGTIGVNGGIGIMKANWKEDGTFALDINADTAYGFSFGASYTYPITSSFGVTADYKLNVYSYDFTSAYGSTFIIDEKISALGLSLYAKF